MRTYFSFQAHGSAHPADRRASLGRRSGRCHPRRHGAERPGDHHDQGTRRILPPVYKPAAVRRPGSSRFPGWDRVTPVPEYDSQGPADALSTRPSRSRPRQQLGRSEDRRDPHRLHCRSSWTRATQSQLDGSGRRRCHRRRAAAPRSCGRSFRDRSSTSSRRTRSAYNETPRRGDHHPARAGARR